MTNIDTTAIILQELRARMLYALMIRDRDGVMYLRKMIAKIKRRAEAEK